MNFKIIYSHFYGLNKRPNLDIFNKINYLKAQHQAPTYPYTKHLKIIGKSVRNMTHCFKCVTKQTKESRENNYAPTPLFQ